MIPTTNPSAESGEAQDPSPGRARSGHDGVDVTVRTAREFVLADERLVTVFQMEPTIRFERESGAFDASALQLARALS